MKLSTAISESHTHKSSQIVWLITLIIFIFFTWAFYSPLDEIVRGVGKVAPIVRKQTIQNLEGGIVESIYVTEGDIVETNQLIAKMDKTKFQSSYQELQEQRLALLIRLARLQAEKDFSNNFILNQELTLQAPQYAESEIALFQAHKKEISTSLENLKLSQDLKVKEINILRPMVARNAVPEIELIRIEQALVETQSRIDATQKEFESRRAQEYADTLVNLRQIEEQIRASKDLLIRTDVLSPVRGVVNKVVVTTIGEIIKPGGPIVEILPLDKKLRIEGRISPQDIGFVFVGMPAKLKLTAFDFSIYGTLSGKVVHVGADSLVDETRQQEETYYEVFIELDETILVGPKGQVDIKPGMQAEIELESGSKTVLQYILKPLFKATEAFSER